MYRYITSTAAGAKSASWDMLSSAVDVYRPASRVALGVSSLTLHSANPEGARLGALRASGQDKGRENGWQTL